MRQQKYEQALRDILEQIDILNAYTKQAAEKPAGAGTVVGPYDAILDGAHEAYSTLIYIRTIAAEALER